MIEWNCSHFDKLSKYELYTIIKARQTVFIVEQKCAYADVDELDLDALHIIAWDKMSSSKELIAYCRIILPTSTTDHFSIGRVLCQKDYRGKGKARELMILALKEIHKLNKKPHIKLAAQCYLTKLYEQFGFFCIGDSFLEDGIEHITMQFKPD